MAADRRGYDANGSTTSGPGRTLAYDGENRPILVTTGAITTACAYGPDGERIRKEVTVPVEGGGTEVRTSYYLGGEAELSPTGVRTKYPHPEVRLIGEAAKCFVHADSLGSIRLETTAGGAAGLRQTYKPFGDRMVTAEGACAGEEKGYIGERHDEEAGLLYLHARWYDLALARFLQPDWWDPLDTSVVLGGGPQGLRTSAVGTNRYAYAGNDPINRSDPGRGGMRHGLSAGGRTSLSALTCLSWSRPSWELRLRLSSRMARRGSLRA